MCREESRGVVVERDKKMAFLSHSRTLLRGHVPNNLEWRKRKGHDLADSESITVEAYDLWRVRSNFEHQRVLGYKGTPDTPPVGQGTNTLNTTPTPHRFCIKYGEPIDDD